MLHYPFFDVVRGTLRNRVSCVVCSVYYTLPQNHEKVYTPDKKIKNSFEVPSNLIFSKTVSSLFAVLDINNYRRKQRTESRVFGGGFHFFSENGKNTLHTTHYTLHTFWHNGVNCEI